MGFLRVAHAYPSIDAVDRALLQLLAEGYQIKVIALRMGLSHRTCGCFAYNQIANKGCAECSSLRLDFSSLILRQSVGPSRFATVSIYGSLA